VFRLVAEISDQSSEQRISIKLGKNASDTCAMLSEAYGGEALKKSSVFEGHKRLKRELAYRNH